MSAARRFLWWFKRRFPRVAWKLRALLPARRREKQRWEGKSTQEVFEAIYEKNLWGSNESRSGAGSTINATAHIRRQIPRILADLRARSILDAPCGDFHWMRHCELGVERYIGADIVPKLIDQLQAEHGSPARSFIHLDIVKDPLPQADVFFCRDCFLHLNLEQIHGALENFCRSACTHLITSTYRDVRVNVDNFTGGARMINLCLPPFNLPEPLEYVEDPGEATFARYLGVWSREQVLSAARPAPR